VRLVREAKSRGLPVTAEVTPHHLALTHEALLGYNTACKVNPPLRTEEDRAALREALRDGTVDCIATDHAPHSDLEKDCEFEAASPGMIGLETTVPVLLELVREGALSPLRLIEALSTRPARVAGLPGGTLAPGAAADITVIDPELDWTVEASSLCSRSANSPWLHQPVRGRAVMTIVNGEIVFGP
jgi:dihydroorotase